MNGSKEIRKKTKKILILGAGLAGLRLGCQLIKKGLSVEIFEKKSFPGGLMETTKWNGFVLDLGPHVFFKEYYNDLNELIGSDLKEVSGLYGIGFKGREVSSPVRPLDIIRKISPRDSLPMIKDIMLKKLLKSKGKTVITTAQDWGIENFGRSIFNAFFRDYIPKVMGSSAQAVAKDWGTDRSRFYKEHNILNGKSFAFLKTILKRMGKKTRLTFFYPQEGSQQTTDAMARFIIENGGIIHNDTEVKRIFLDKEMVKGVIVVKEGKERKVMGSLYVNTIPITEMIKMISSEEGEQESTKGCEDLSFQSLWLFYLLINRQRLSEKIQTYFPESEYIFKRIYEPKNLNNHMGNGKNSAICVEVGYREGDRISSMSESYLFDEVFKGIKKFYGLEKKEILDYFSKKIPYAYAVYKLGYEKILSKISEALFEIENLISFGRQGSFRYNYLHDSVMEAADKVADFIVSEKRKKDFLGSPDAKAIFF